MITIRAIRPLTFITALCLGACTTPSGTGRIDANKLCGGQSGFGARIEGGAMPVDMCVSEVNTITTLGAIDPNRYCVVANYTVDSLTIEVELSFVMQSVLPRAMQPSADQLTAFLDAGGVWFQYRELQTGLSPVRADSISGNFTLTFADSTVVVATFDNLYVGLVDTLGQTSTRQIQSGFLSVIPDI